MLAVARLSALVILVAVTAASTAQSVPPQVQRLRWVLSADPIADAKEALRRGDRTLMAVRGLTWTIPGVEPARKLELRERYGMRLIEGTGDAALNAEHLDLMKRAAEYARKYNLYLLEHPGSDRGR